MEFFKKKFNRTNWNKWINNQALRGTLWIIVFLLLIFVLFNILYEYTETTWLSLTYWKANSEFMRNAGLLLVATIGAIIASVRGIIANKMADTAGKTQVTSSFTDAITQLGDKELSIRLGGIYALRKIAEDQPESYKEVIGNTLQAFIRSTSKDRPTEKDLRSLTEEELTQKQIKLDISEIKEDISAALSSIFILKLKKISLPYTILNAANLKDANLKDANLQGAVLYNANLSNATLIGANLSNATLIGANLRNANLMEASLMEASLMEASLMEASLWNANLSNANLVKANLVKANLMEATLLDANLMEANLMNANLRGANLSNANLVEASLLDANLMEANLMNANLQGVNLSNASLWVANLMEANLMEANLMNVNLLGANLMGANFKNVINFSLDLLLTASNIRNIHFDKSLENQLRNYQKEKSSNRKDNTTNL